MTKFSKKSYQGIEQVTNEYQHPMESLFKYICSLTSFSDASWQNLAPALKEIKYKKGGFLLLPGAICNELSFISAGYCRAFYRKGDQEINTAFFFETDIATNINSFAKGAPSEFAIQACEDISIVRFDKKILREVSQTDPQIETLGRLCLQQIAIRQEKHAAIFKLMDAQERYEYLERFYPEILQRVPLTQLSTYLGVARETLSRIRKRRV